MASSSGTAGASALVTRIGALIDDLQMVVEGVPRVGSDANFVLFSLRNYKVLLLSATRVGEDPSIQAFLQTLQRALCGLESWVHTLRLFLTGELVDSDQLDDVDGFGQDFGSLGGQIPQFYENLFASCFRGQSSPLAAPETGDMFASLMKNLSMLYSLEWEFDIEIVAQPLKALGEQMLFLENLRLFTSKAADSDANAYSSAHAESVFVYAAIILFGCQAQNHNGKVSQEMISGISTLIDNTKPIDPRVYKTYTDMLKSSRSRRRLLAPADRDMDQEDNYAKSFLDSLRSNLLEMLLLLESQGEKGRKGFLGSLWSNLLGIMQLCSHQGVVSVNDQLRGVVSSMKDQLQELYDGLGSLTIILSHQPSQFDLNTKDQFFDVVCDAGIFICSLYQTHLQLNHDLEDLLGAIRLVLAAYGKKAAPEQRFNNFPSTAPLSFVDFLLEELRELTSDEVETNTRRHAQAIKEELVTLRSFLENIVELWEEQEVLQTLKDQILELLYRAEHLIDYLMVGDLSDSFSLNFDSTMKDIANIKLEVQAQKLEMKRKGLTTTCQHHVPSQRNPVSENVVVGYIEEAESIKDLLTRGSRRLRIVAIVGMPGQGKTTLATKVYYDPSISFHFLVCARTVVSQIVDKRRILLDLLGQIDPDKCSGITSDQDLVEKLWRSLKGKRYLIFLDDIWEAGAWSSLADAFPDDEKASRIMLTSRHHDVAPSKELQLHELRPFSEEESMDLLQRKLFGESGWPIELINLGREIAQKCKGLPLTILILAGILSTVEQEGWKKILGGLQSGVVLSTEQCMNTLELSYNHLPEHLRPCLLYLVTFPEDEEVSVWRLFHLWIAEGFVRRHETKCAEDVSEDYLKDLLGRSLITVSKVKSTGGMKACRIHDLLHGFYLRKAKEEGFVSFLGEIDKVLENQAPYYLRRLCINSDPKHLRMSNRVLPNVRSLNFNYYVQRVLPNPSFMFQVCKLLRVLDLERLNLGGVFPNEIGLLVKLAFLAIRGCMADIPPSIGNLSNLETFIFNHSVEDKTVLLPDNFWNLQKLRHIYMTGEGGIFPMENLTSSSDLCKLDWLSGVAIPYSPSIMEQLLKKFPNIRKLKCSLLKPTNTLITDVKIVVPESLSRLESVSLSLSYEGVTSIEFSLPANLKKLTLSSFPLPSKGLAATILRLPNLEVLKFEDVIFQGHTWEMEEGEFSKLRFLQLSSWGLTWWTASEYDCLEKLVLLRCGSLEEMPSCLEELATLKVIELRYCSMKVLELVGKIKEAQEGYGNSELKIINVNSG